MFCFTSVEKELESGGVGGGEEHRLWDQACKLNSLPAAYQLPHFQWLVIPLWALFPSSLK